SLRSIPTQTILWLHVAAGAPVRGCRERGMTRVVGGRNAEVGAWPWLVSIQDPSVSGTGHLCGGSLISTRWVLTAAHCFAESRNISAMRLLIGAIQLTEPGPEAEVRLIKRLLIHKEYGPADQSNDIALLELNKPVQCNSHIQLVCVPNATVNVAQLDTCYVAGWGATTARCDDILQEAKVHLINVQICNGSEWYQGDVHSHNLCAGYPEGGIDTCQGDSGGPLMCKDNDADFFWVVGVTSWGRGCARAKRPGIYTSVQHFYDWIVLQMEMLPQSWNPYTTPWTRPPPTQMPWTRPPSTYNPWPTTLPPPKPWPTTLPPPKPWPTAHPAPNPWPTAPPTPKPWPTTMPPPKPWPTTLPAPNPWPTACSVLPILLLYMYASANVDLVAEIKLPLFVVNYAFSPVWSPGQGKDFLAHDLQNEAASEHLGTKGVTLKGWNCVWPDRRVLRATTG
uniref:Acrosin n=1 Tax=Geospiza parvula TaxID=87175 RepID=A0A8C3Q5W1_GEOPR